MCAREKTCHLTSAFPSAFHLRNDNHSRNIAAVSPLGKTIGLTLFPRHLVSKIRKDFNEIFKTCTRNYPVLWLGDMGTEERQAVNVLLA